MLILVFLMKDLGGLFQEILWDLDESEEIINDINVARLKEEVLKGIHTLRAEKWKNYFINIRWTCLKSIVTQSSHKYSSIVLSRTAKIICKHMSYHHYFIQFQRFLKGLPNFDNYNVNSNNIIVNISQTWNI